jgi:hypothetical protein
MSMGFFRAEDETIHGAFRRHIRLVSWIEAVRVAAFVVLTIISILGATANQDAVTARNAQNQPSDVPVVPNAGEMHVTLDANPRYINVQLFNGVQATSKVVATLPVGTQCTALETPHSTTLQGIAMTFYHLDCGGTVGYVNARWVRVNE